VSLLVIGRKAWKYKLFMVPVAAVVLACAYYVLAVKAPTYESGATYILVNPPPPSLEALDRPGADNPYLRFSSQAVLVEVLESRLNSEQTRKRLIKHGADPNYTVTSNPEFGLSGPILQIIGTGESPAAAVQTTFLVGAAMTDELRRMQDVRRVDQPYRIKAQAVVGTRDAALRGAGKMRPLLAVLALGAILMFVVMSFLDAIGALRAERAANPISEAMEARWPLPAHR